MAKQYYWLKLPDSFFRDKAIKKLRRIAGGDTYTVIYLKMLLVAMKQDGKLYFDGVEDDFFSELSLDLDEDEDNIKVTCQYLLAQGLMSTVDGMEYELPACKTMIGKETAAAERMRRMRNKKSTEVTSKSVTMLHGSYTSVTHGLRREEIEKEIEKEIDSSSPEKEEKKEKSATQDEEEHPPTLEQVKEFADKYNLSVNPDKFWNYYEGCHWLVSGTPVNNWKSLLCVWAKNGEYTISQKPQQKTKFSNFHEREYNMEDLEKQLLGGM